MFILTTISDLIQISPQDFEKPSVQALKDNINKKYSNKVIQKIGLCICFFDLLKSSEGLIGHGTGIVNVNVEFRMVVFRPFKGEIIQGKIKHCNITGITIHLDFFSDIFIPAPVNLFEGVRLYASAFNSPGEYMRELILFLVTMPRMFGSGIQILQSYSLTLKKWYASG